MLHASEMRVRIPCGVFPYFEKHLVVDAVEKVDVILLEVGSRPS